MLEKEIRAVLTDEQNIDSTIYLEPLRGAQGYSAYELAVRNGFEGTEYEWINSLSKSNYYRLYSNTYTATEDLETAQIAMSLPVEYKPEVDMLFVFVNGLKALLGVDFTIENNVLSFINKIDKGTVIYYAIPRTINIHSNDYELLRGPAGGVEWNNETDYEDMSENILQLENLMIKGTSIGSSITLNDSADYKVLKLEVDGASKQTTTSVKNGDEYDSPSPDYPQEVEVVEGAIQNKFVGENQFKITLPDYKTNVVVEIESKKLKLTSNGTYSRIDFNKKVKPNTTYYFSSLFENNSSNKILLGVFKSDGTQIGLTNATTDVSGKLNISFKSDVEDIVLRMYVNNTNTSNTNTVVYHDIMFSEYDLSYKPYSESVLNTNLQGNFMGKIGDIADTLRIENGRAILTKRIVKSVFNGSESGWSWGGGSQDLTNTNLFYILLSDQSKEYSASVVPTLCSHFGIRTVWGVDEEGAFLQSNNGALMFRISKDKLTENTLSAFKIWLSENPVTVYYVLAEPYEIDLGKVTMPKTYKNTTHISTIDDLQPELSVTYVKDLETLLGGVSNAS